MLENLDQLIDINLKLLCEFKGSLFMINRFRDENNRPLGRLSSNKLAISMKSKNLIEIHSNNIVITLKEFGSNIHLNGGWLKHLKDIDILKEKEKNNIALKDEKIVWEVKKLALDYKLSKWQVKTFWWIFGFALFGGVYSSIDLISNLTKAKGSSKEQITKEQMESELSKLRTLILDQKNIDSLSNSKTEKIP